ncbi:MAG: hypothetical protein ACREUG_06575 [Steroidobacteraceae bacterium]
MDFVIYGDAGLRAIEVKSSRRIESRDLTALEHFAEDYPQASRYLLYRGEDRVMRNGVLCMPVEQFLMALKPGAFPE